MRVVTVNVNGVRAAGRRGGLAWLAASGADVICLQEVRASDAQLRSQLATSGLAGANWHLRHNPGPRAGHAGVAVLSRLPMLGNRPHASMQPWCEQGRWAEAEVAGGVVVACAYVHTGAADGPRAVAKQEFLTAIGGWLDGHRHQRALLCGDLNVAHTPCDIKNWRGNVGRAGFLESERSHLDHWLSPAGLGWVDLGRQFGGDGPGPYTWWSWRGRSFDNDAGWRIDYALASPAQAPAIRDLVVARSADYASRWSDHAALVVDMAGVRG